MTVIENDTELTADVSYFLLVRDDREKDPGVRQLKSWILEKFANAG